MQVFLSQLVLGLVNGSFYAMLSLGLAVIFGLLGIVNFAHGALYMLGAYAAYIGLERFGINYWVALVVAPIVIGALGVVIERLALRPLRGVPGTAAMITTIGVSYILFNVILLTVGAGSENYPNPLPVVRWQFGEVTLELKTLLIWGVAMALMVALHLFVNRTRLGRAMRATAQDAEAARMMGVDVDRVVVTAFFLGSALAGAAALIFGLYYNYTSFIIGYTAGLRAFTAAVLGGIGSVPGAMVGGVLIGLIETLGGQLIAVRWTDVIIFSILILVLVFVPTGLFGRAAPTKS